MSGDGGGARKSVSIHRLKECIGLGMKGVQHCVHAMIWTPSDRLVLRKRYPTRANVLMQMRFDGKLGFPGGIVDDDISHLDAEAALSAIVEALNRELVEEVNVDLSIIRATEDDHCASQIHYDIIKERKMAAHFFTIKVSASEFEELERRALAAEYFGDEVMGHFRVPLFTMRDGDNGFNTFMRNNFAGSAKAQLCLGLISEKIFTQEEIDAVDKANMEILSKKK